MKVTGEEAHWDVEEQTHLYLPMIIHIPKVLRFPIRVTRGRDVKWDRGGLLTWSGVGGWVLKQGGRDDRGDRLLDAKEVALIKLSTL